ncbi:MAG: hypothetical protein OER90_04690 [Gemmatimonadota bacterium]|nr:hypothetical protein [Gemmatimonadota bacterium]
MRRRDFFLTTVTAAAACATRRRVAPLPGPQRGIAFDGYLAPEPTISDVKALHALGVSHVALFPFGYMRGHRDPEVLRFGGPDTHWSLTDDGLLRVGHLAQQAGIGVVVLPTLADFVDGRWRGEIEMDDERGWETWLASYEQFIVHYAALAAKMDAVGFSVGTELRSTVHRTDWWRRVIATVRRRFSGWLTYAANWDDFDQVPWWPALDLVGVQAYFELGTPPAGGDPVNHLVEAWAPIRDRLASLSSRVGRRVLFTEIGYKSHVNATARPWQWELSGLPDPSLQRAAYEAAFRVFWHEPWFAGFYWWKWKPNATSDEEHARDFSPQGKPAETVLRRYYGSGE